MQFFFPILFTGVLIAPSVALASNPCRSQIAFAHPGTTVRVVGRSRFLGVPQLSMPQSMNDFDGVVVVDPKTVISRRTAKTWFRAIREGSTQLNQVNIYGPTEEEQRQGDPFAGIQSLDWEVYRTAVKHLKEVERAFNSKLPRRESRRFRFVRGALRAVAGTQGIFVSDFHTHPLTDDKDLYYTEALLGPGTVFPDFVADEGIGTLIGKMARHRSPVTEEDRLLLLALYRFE